MKETKISKRTTMVACLVIVSLLSIFLLTRIATSQTIHAPTIKVLDEKKMEVAALTTATAGTAAAISAVPGDATTPIANQLTELSSYLLIVICAIFLEKFLITTTGFLTFSLLIPLSCILLIVYLYKRNEVLKRLAIKLTVFGIAIFMIIPVSIQVSNLVDKTFKTSDIVESVTEKSKDAEKSAKSVPSENVGFSEALSGIKETISDFTVGVAEKAKNVVSDCIDAIAALIVTACVIPIAVMFFFMWITKIVFGIDIRIPKKEKSKKINRKEEQEDNFENISESADSGNSVCL